MSIAMPESRVLPVPDGSTRPQRLTVRAAGRDWVLERPCDMETLWERMGEGDLDPDERLPYWAEVWPAGILLADYLAGPSGHDGLEGLACLDLGCGLGLTALAGAWLGGRVLGVDYEPEAVAQAKANAALNRIEGAAFALMDWRRPGLRAGVFHRIWGGDILYEKRFFEPVEALLAHALAPGGRVLVGEPRRTVSAQVWQWLSGRGWQVRQVAEKVVEHAGQRPTVRLWELSRQGE